MRPALATIGRDLLFENHRIELVDIRMIPVKMYRRCSMPLAQEEFNLEKGVPRRGFAFALCRCEVAEIEARRQT